MPRFASSSSGYPDRICLLNLRVELVFALLHCYWQSLWDWRMTLL
ncbi:MAG: hypothetical protein AAGG51_30125 [Cyanobacteria bacterium P01_G01_bin.54]